jgi:ribosomal protein S18 acetylase RimI-like enzyme
VELFEDKNRGSVAYEQIMRKRDSHPTEDISVEIADAGLSNVSDMANCHSLAFKGRFMTEMGHQWLCVLYRYFIKHPGGINVVAVDERSKMLGFAVGGEPGIRDELIRYAVVRYPNLILLKFLTNSLVRKVMLEVLVRKIFKRKPLIAFSKNSTKQVTTIRTGNLLSICVLPECRGTGVAGKLMDSFRKTCSAKGFKRLTLSVVTENARAIAFYNKLGWHEVGKSGESSKLVLEL